MSAISDVLVTASYNSMNVTTASATVGTDKTFKPYGPIAPGVQRYVEKSGSDPIIWPSFTIGVRAPLPKGPRAYRTTVKLALPVANISAPSTGSGIQPLPSKAYELICNMEFIVPEAASTVNKTLFWSYICSLLADTTSAGDGSPIDNTGSPIKAAVVSFEQPY